MTPPNLGNDATDSDTNELTGRTAPVTVVAGEQNTTVDAGLVHATGVAIGNMVWCDTNGDGIKQPSEPGLGGVTVRLYGLGPDGAPYTADDVLVQTTTTDANGFYLFIRVPEGSYYVAVVQSTVKGCGTLSSAGGNHNPDICDQNLPQGDDGIPGPTPSTVGLAVTQGLYVRPGGQSTPDTGDPLEYADNSSYMTFDFGFT